MDLKALQFLEDRLDKKQEYTDDTIKLFDCDLTEANLSNKHLTDSSFILVKFDNADFKGTDFTDSMFDSCSLQGCDFKGANLRDCLFFNMDLTGCDFTDADLSNCRFYNCNLDEAKINVPFACPQKGSFIGYKQVFCKVDSQVLLRIVKLEIPEDAKRSSAFTKKCRCNKAKVLEIQDFDGSKSDIQTAFSTYDHDFIYWVGETVEVDDFDDNRWNECSTGIHFFTNREDAVGYNHGMAIYEDGQETYLIAGNVCIESKKV